MTKRRNLRRRRSLRSTPRSLHHETLEKRELLAVDIGDAGPRLISVAANSGQQFDLDGNNVLSVAPTELTFRFDGAQALDPSTLDAIQIRGTGGDGTVDPGDPTIIPGFLGFADSGNPRVVVARFAETLPDDQYVIEIAGYDDTDPNNPIVGLRNVDGTLFSPPRPEDTSQPKQTILLDIEVGPRVIGIVPQPVVGVGAGRVQMRDTVHVYFNNDPLSNPNAGVITTATSSLSVVQPQFYKLLYTHDTVENTDDGAPFEPMSVEYDPALNRATLTFADDLSILTPAAANNGSGTYRLRVGSGDPLPAPPSQFIATLDAGDTFGAAAPLGVPFGGIGTQSVTVTGGVIRSSKDVIPFWPGAADVPGLRDQRRDTAVVGRLDTNTGINTFEYNFANLYGQDAQGNNLDNAITPAQRDRAREILGLYSERLGVEFVETENRGLQIVTGDLRAIVVKADTGDGTPYSIYRVNDADPTQGVLILDAGENWYDGYGLSPDDDRPSWFVEALRGIGNLLGMGNTFELPPGDATGGSSPPEPNATGFISPDPAVPLEPDFLTEGNIITGQALHRPESDDIDFYHFQATTNGKVTLETFAQRLEDSSLLDTHLKLYQVIDAAAGEYKLVATNDDFFSDDSFISVDLEIPHDAFGNPIPTDFIVGVSAAGNDQYNGEVAGSGLGGVSEGAYELRVTFDAQVGQTITDTSGTELDGDADGRAGGDFNFWFRVANDNPTPAADEPRVIFVDKFNGDDFLNSGSLLSPYQTISNAFTEARPGDIVRLLPNGGVDGLISTSDDNLAYEIGRGGSGNVELSDGGEFEVPQGVTVMIDAGSILKLRTAKISVGSESVDEDRSLAALQILGTPESPLDANGNPLAEGLGSVVFTSYDDASFGVDTNTLNVPPQPGDWAGIEFRNDFDLSEGRAVWEREGIFLDYSSHADIRYGGGSISPTQPIVNPLQMAEARPTLIHNTITDSADAAISADPNSFRETNFHAPLFQRVAAFTSDYDRVGPEIYGNTLVRNTTNGLFVRVVTPAAGQLEPMTVAGRMDDRDITHVISQVLALQGQPGGSLLLEQRPDVLNVTFSDAGTGSLTPGAMFDYRITFVTSEGRESLASDPTSTRVVPAGGAITLNNLNPAPAEFAGRRIYRIDPVTGDYIFVSQLDRNSTSYTDDGTTRGGVLPDTALAPVSGTRLMPRFDARLSIDPGLIVKLENARIEAGFGSDFYAEGVDGDSIIFTSLLDDRFGAGGTFDTNNSNVSPTPGDWGGLVFRQDSTGSLDYTEIQFAGGTAPIEGGFTEFNAVEILQADVRIAHSVLRQNADGFISNSIRGGRGFNDEATIFVRGSQPIIVDNTIYNNRGAAISINPDALNFHDKLDSGRATGPSDIVVTDLDNQGPLVFGNRLDLNGINGMVVRSEVLQTESVWDDTDIVHVVQGEIDSLTHHHRGGLRLKSDPNQSLVVKFDTLSTLVGGGRPLDIDDRIGGTLQVLGQPGQPVILTSIQDCSVGAGFSPEGLPMNDTINSGGCGAEALYGPMIDQFTDTAPNIDEWIIVADDSGSISVEVYNENQGIIAIDGRNPVTINGETVTITLDNVVPGSEHVFTHELIGGLAHYRPRFIGAQHVYLREDRTSPNDVFNSASGTGTEIGSNLELGFDARFDTLPSIFADTTWFYDLDPGDQFTWRGFFDDFPGGADATQIDLIDPAGNIIQSITGPSLLPGNGTTLTATVGPTQGGFWGVKLTAPPVIAPFAGHYLMDVEVLDSQGVRDADKSERHYLLTTSFVGSSTGFAAPGDWLGLQLESYVNDRNVAYVIESERAIPAAIGENAIADQAQVIGDLAAHEYAGDESERLGFNIRGTLASSDDQDVYRFTADGGTVVYIDIDDTSFGLDTVVELIDVNDQVLARSDNSFAESMDPALLVNNLSPGSVLPLFQLGTGNVESPNSLDAGMRVILDGTGTDNTYFVRVRSNGESSGQYQLAIRLRETDEVAGSTIQLADIRFATNAITVSGTPLHSPLAGDATEELDYLADGTPVDVDNTQLVFTEANSTHIGNLLTSDRGSLRVTGDIGNIRPNLAFEASDEIDVFQVDLFAQDIAPDVFDNENRFVTTTFDIDYADGLGRVNTNLAVFDAFGRLILHSRDSNVADDVGRPLQGDDPTNLEGGSVGVLDAHIGPVELPEGTYYVAVSSAVAVPQALDQFFNENATASDVRLMPINALRRISDDSFDVDFIGQHYSADEPLIQPLFDQSSIVPYSLDDIRLFVSLDSGISGNNRSSLASFNPFTGTMERLIGQSAQPTGDLATRRDGELFSISLGPPNGQSNPGNTGNFLNISPVDGSATNVGDDGIGFMQNNQNGDNLETRAPVAPQFDIHAMTFPLVDLNAERSGSTAIQNGERFIVVGERVNATFIDNGRSGEIPDIYARNILYEYQSNSGAVTSLGSTNANAHRNFNATVPYFPELHGATSPDREFGFVDTGDIFGGGDGGTITGMGMVPDSFLGSEVVAVTDRGGVHLFDYTDTVVGPNSGFFGGFGFEPRVIQTTFFGVVEPDPLHAAQGAFTDFQTGGVVFEGMAFGPRVIENGEYRDTIFAVTSDGWLYGLEIDGTNLNPANVFYNGRSAIPLTFTGGFDIGVQPNGLAFSVLENNPWDFTVDRRNDTDHGVFIPYDQSRIRTVPPGGSSLYFGFEITNNEADNTVSRPDNDPLGEISPGGAHGTVISQPFNLENYSSDDKPTLYFTYFLEVEDPDDYLPGVRVQRDAFRAYGAGDDGEWKLLATNNDFRELPFADEYDHFFSTDIPVQELFDDQNEWRQARVDLSPFAGSENVRIRFDFSTAGSVLHQMGSLELVAVDGDEVEDREILSFVNENFQPVTLDNIVGRDIIVPAGSELSDGDQFGIVTADSVSTASTFLNGFVTPTDTQIDVFDASVFGPAPFDIVVGGESMQVVGVTGDTLDVVRNPLLAGFHFNFETVSSTTVVPFNVTFVTGTPSNPGEVQFNSLQTADEVAMAVVDALPSSFRPRNEGGGRISLYAATDIVAGTAPVGQSNPTQVVRNGANQLVVPDGINISSGDEFIVSGAGTTTRFLFVEAADATGVADEFIFDRAETAQDIGARIIERLPDILDPVLERDGRITFVNSPTVFFTFSPATAVNRISPEGPRGPLEYRIEVIVPDGDTLVDGSVMNITDAAGGTAQIQFVQSATPVGPGVVEFQLGEPATVIAQRLQAQLAASHDALLNQTGDGVLIIARRAEGAPGVTSDDVESVEVRMPDGSASLLNDTLTIFDDAGIAYTVNFAVVTTPTPPIPPAGPNPPAANEGTVFYQLTDTADTIAANVALAFQNIFTSKVVDDPFTVTIPPVADTILFFDAARFATTDSTTSIVDPLAETVEQNRLEVLMPDGFQLFDGAQLTIDGAEESATFTFVFNTVSEGPGTVHFQPGDTPADIASRLFPQLPRSLDPLMNLAGDGILVLADDASGVFSVIDQPIGAELITFPDGSVPLRNDSVILEDALGNFPQINFVEVATPTPPIPATVTPLAPGTVFYQVTDTAEEIAANFALAVANLFVTINRGDTIEMIGAANTFTTDPDSMIIHDATLGQFIDLPFTGAGLIDGEQVFIESPFGDVVIRFVDGAFPPGPFDVSYAQGTLGDTIEDRLNTVLPSYLRAIVTQAGTSGPVVQILGATDVTPLDANSLIVAGPNAYARSVLNLDIKDGVDIRNGEQIELYLPNAFPGFPGLTVPDQVITFVRRGGITSGLGTIQVFYDDTTLASDLYDQIVTSLLPEFQAYIALSTTEPGPGSRPTGINIGAPGATAIIREGIAAFTESTVNIDEFAIPITLPAGDDLVDGEQLVITPKDDPFGFSTVTITFNEGTGTPAPNQVLYELTDTPDVIAQKLYDALPRSLQGFLVSSKEIFLLNASAVATDPGSAIVSFELAPGTVPIQITSEMTSEEVAVVLQSSLAEGFGRLATIDGSNNASAEDYAIIGGDRIQIYNALVNEIDSYGVASQSRLTATPFNLDSSNFFGASESTPLPAEAFGTDLPDFFATNEINTVAAANNNIEGVYIDDIIVGFAERGEMVLNAPINNRTFDLDPEYIRDTRPEAVQPERPNETLTGPYSLEIRTSDEYGVPEDFDPINLNLGEQVTIEGGASSSGRSFDTNDRLADGAVTLIAQPGISLIDGDTFVLSDGTRQLTFEFDSILDTSVPSVTVGNVPVPFDPIEARGTEIAAAIRDAINSNQAQSVLDITAATGDSREVGQTNSTLVELFGPAISVNPGPGRFIKMDLVAEETFQGRETSKLIPLVDHVNQTVTYPFHSEEFSQGFGDTLARAAVTGFADGTVDVLVATGKIGDQVNTGRSGEDAPVILGGDPADDFDTVRIYLRAGQTVDIDVDSLGFAKGAQVLDLPVIGVFDSQENLAINGLGGGVAQTSFVTPTRAPGEIHDGAFLKFQAQVDGYYDVVVQSASFGDFGEYQLTIRPDAASSPVIPDRDVVGVDYHFGKGDVNRVKDQGQIIIASNFISDSAGFGVLATSGVRGEGFATVGNNLPIGVNTVPDNLPRPGSANLLRNINTDQLVPGAVISNNVIVDAAAGGISFTGGTANNGEAPASVPMGRIVNNTVVGAGSGSGITVGSNASPTLLNNLVSGFDIGLDIDTSSAVAGTVVGANAFQNNNTNSTVPLATTSVDIQGPVFQDPDRRIYIPVAGSVVIDSSFSSLPDRGDFFNTVKDPVGISASPIIAPLFDAYGQPRFDDPTVNPPGGGGEIVTIDRGAIDRADRTPLVAVLTGPQDAIGTVVPGGDRDTDESFVRLIEGTVEFFEIQLLDPAGTGPDPDTITAQSVLLTENGRRLEPGVDFIFGYSDNSRTIRLTPLAGLWLPDAVYEITLNNQPRIAYEAMDGSEISDGDQLTITDNDGNRSIFEFESGYSMAVPQTTLLTVTGTNADFQDRDTFRITSPNGNSLTFEINLAGGTAGGNIAVDLTQATTVVDVRDAILSVLQGALPTDPTVTVGEFLDIDPVAVSHDQIQLGTLAGHSGPTAIAGMDVTGQADGIADGQTFTYSTATETITFEFDSNNALNDPTNVRIPFTRQSTPGEIGRAIVEAVQVQPLGLFGAVSSSAGVVTLGGVSGDILDVTLSSLNQVGTPGVTGSLTLTIPAGENGASIDGTTFNIDVDGTAINFRYTTDSTLTSPDRLVLLDPTDLVTDIASKTAAEIGRAFPDELSPSASGDVVTLGEQPAIPPAGETGSLTTVDGGTANLIVDGVSGGTIPVSFLPTSPSTSIAATLQSEIARSPLNVTTFSPGGGTILISGAAMLQSALGGGVPTQDGTFTPAVADLAGNPVRETRVNNETRFTIIMPEVVFDLGDAPRSYGTMFAENGARHTVDGTRLPRLGRFIDTELDGQPTNRDDSPLTVDIVPGSPSVFNIDSFADVDRITLTSMPIGGETLSITVGPVARTFELVEKSSNPSGVTIPVIFSDDDTLDEITTKLINVIRTEIPETDDGLLIERDATSESNTTLSAAVAELDNTIIVTDASVFEDSLPFDIRVDGELMTVTAISGNTLAVSRNNPEMHSFGDEVSGPTTFVITAVDDEDGISGGVYTDPATNIDYNVFTVPGTDPNNIQADQVLGFLNPEDPAGTNLAVNVFGAGLLHAWIDFDQSGTFEDDEQVITNLPVSGDEENGSANIVTVFTPDTAVQGMTWMRVRISESGNLSSTGVAVGGEVEDYLVEIISVPLPDPQDDEYIINEDATDGVPPGRLDTANNVNFPSLTANDPPTPGAFLPEQVIVGELPTNGTLTIVDATTGDFIYEPSPDFYGIDTFTYRLSTQQNISASAISLDSFATVTITVQPINDQPAGVDRGLIALEDQPLIIDADLLLGGAVGDVSADYVSPSNDPLEQRNEAFLNELNQHSSLGIFQIQGTDAPVDASNAASLGGTNLQVTPNALNGLDILVTDLTADLVTVAFAGQTWTFELALENTETQPNTTAVSIGANDTTVTLASRLATTMETTLRALGSLQVSHAPGTNLVSLEVAPEEVTAGAELITFPSGAIPLQNDTVRLIDGVTNPLVRFQQVSVPTPPDPATGSSDGVVYFQTTDTPDAIAANFALAIVNFFDTIDRGDTLEVVGARDTLTTDPNSNIIHGPAAASMAISSPGDTVTIDVIGTPNPTPAPTPQVPDPATGDTVTVSINGTIVTFELIEEGATETPGNIPVTVLPFSDPTSDAARASVAAQLAAAIQAELDAANLIVVASVDGNANPYQVTIEPQDVTAGKAFETDRGQVIAVFDTFGDLIELRYISAPGEDFNRDNPWPTASPHTDEFIFTVRDNGVSIDLVNNWYVYGQREVSDPSTVTIDVAPRNDAPISGDDHITVGELGNPDATLTDWEIFGTGVAPTEDQTLVIPIDFLLRNDLRGPSDEDPGPNDLGLGVSNVTLVNGLQGSIFDSGTNIIFTPAADLFGDILFTYRAIDRGIDEAVDGTRVENSLPGNIATVTITVQPVNDAPVAYDRALSFNESDQPGPGSPFVFSRDDLIIGTPPERPNVPGDFFPFLASPFNESEQTLRVVTFSTAAGTIDASSLGPGSGMQTLTLPSDAGGTLEFDFFDGIFTIGRFISDDDYNLRTPFDPVELFTYSISDDGLTTNPQTGGQFTLPEERSNSATVTITMQNTNDAPTFDFDVPVVNGLPTLDVLERDDLQGTVIDDFAINILPGPPTALDEIDRQSVVFTFPAGLNPSTGGSDDLFTQLPELSPEGQLIVYPSVDAIGTATFVVQAEDLEPGTPGFMPRTTLRTFVVNVQPVNDAPRFDSNVAGTFDGTCASGGQFEMTGGELLCRFDVNDVERSDEAYSVARFDFDNDGEIDDATITYQLREDNTQPLGVLEDYFIPLTAAPSVGYSRIGLLDVFTVGPDNEAGPNPGGSQIVEFLQAGNAPMAPSLDRTTDRGGILTPVFDSGNVLIGLNYRPPLDFNESFAGVDSFTYVVRDDSTTGGETFSLAAEALVPDQRTTTNRVELVLNPVNDRPEFTVETLNIDVQEDSSEVRFINYASNISAGPPNTAFDEVDITTGQSVEFTVTSLDFPREDADNFFSVFPSVNEQDGLLNFQAAPDVFGEFRFEIVLNDQNLDGSISDNTLRGDLMSSIPVTLTINVQPINDPPIVRPDVDPLEFTLLEDGSFDILVTGDNTSPGLLDQFFPGPFNGAADEGANILPQLGGNQTVSLGSPLPTTSAEGGTLQFITSSGTPRFRYTPRQNFVGTDSFIYTVTDNGITVGIDGVPFSDPRIAANTVTFEVLPVNDAPLFSGAGNVDSLEDQGIVTIDDWATNVQAGPTTAIDELLGDGTLAPQALYFEFTQLTSLTNLFLAGPDAIIDPLTGTASLTYETNPDANGVAVFEVVLFDRGPNDASIGDENESEPRTFTIDVGAVNDPPTFDLDSDDFIAGEKTIERLEDSGPFNTIVAQNVSPGPPDEQSQTVTFEIEPLAPEFESLFVDPPTINSDGLLRFTPAPNQNTDNINGPVVIRVLARDSEGGVSETQEFKIRILEVNDPPRAVSDSLDSDEDTVLVIESSQLTANDIDPDVETNGDMLSVVMPAQSFSVSGALITFDDTTGQITYDPTDSTILQALAPGDELVDSFAYSVQDLDLAGSNLVTVAINITGVNDAPIVRLDTPQLNPDGPTLIPVLANDNDVDGSIIPSSVQVTLQPAFGSLVIRPDGVIEYRPFASFNEEDVFTYTVADNLGLRSEEAFVTIAANASPIALDDRVGTFLDESVMIDVSENDSDPDGELDLTSIEIVTQPRRGQAVPQPDGTIQYLPDPGFLGRDTFEYRISDTLGRGSNVAGVEVEVVASRLQNPDEVTDVNDDGSTSALDALLIINALARNGGMSFPVEEDDRGPNYYDVSGNQLVSANDALRVINELSRQNSSGIEAEQVQLALGNDDPEANRVFDAPAPIDFRATDKIVDASSREHVSPEVVDLIAEGNSDQDDDAAGKTIDAIDAAMADLL